MVILGFRHPLTQGGEGELLLTTGQHLWSWVLLNMWIGTLQQDNTIYIMDSPQLSANWIFDPEPYD